MLNTILLTTGSLIIIAAITLYFYNVQQKKRLRKTYMDALFGNDIQKAIAAGKAYYRSRSRALNTEKAIQRDLEKNGLDNYDRQAG